MREKEAVGRGRRKSSSGKVIEIVTSRSCASVHWVNFKLLMPCRATAVQGIYHAFNLPRVKSTTTVYSSRSFRYASILGTQTEEQ